MTYKNKNETHIIKHSSLFMTLNENGSWCLPLQRSSTCRCGPEVFSYTQAADELSCPVTPPSDTTSLDGERERHMKTFKYTVESLTERHRKLQNREKKCKIILRQWVSILSHPKMNLALWAWKSFVRIEIYCVKAPTSSSAGCDGSAVVFEVQSAGCVEDRVHKDICLTLLQHVQDFLQTRKATKKGRRWSKQSFCTNTESIQTTCWII